MSEQQTTEDEDVLSHEEWASELHKGHLLGQKCASCEFTTTTPKAACVRCGALELEKVKLPTEGTVYSESGVSVTPKGFNETYHVALVELGDTKARLLARVNTAVEIGDAVEFVDTFEYEGMPAPVFNPSTE
jgi:uncharacterized OB-fold protein